LPKSGGCWCKDCRRSNPQTSREATRDGFQLKAGNASAGTGVVMECSRHRTGLHTQIPSKSRRELKG
jgi:hypothetical protein